jgi:hypothetical protein
LWSDLPNSQEEVFKFEEQVMKNVILCLFFPNTTILITSGFWPRVRARALRAPVFLGSLTRQKGRCAPPPPVHSSFAASHSSKIKTTYFLKQNASLQASGPNPGRQGRISFRWAKLHPTELHCTLLSYAATS